MNRITSKLLILFSILFLGMNSLLIAQTFKNSGDVKYLQLPAETPIYSSAEIFVELDRSETAAAISFGMKKLTGGNEKISGGIDSFLKKVLANSTSKITTWDLFPELKLNEGDEKLKVVLTYSPDDSARPMGDPMKDGKGFYRFPYRVNAAMKILNSKDEILFEQSFGALSGKGKSKTWGGDSKAVISTSEKQNANAYEEACMNAVLEHAKRFVYGRYGMKEFSVPMGVAIIKKQKESKEYKKQYDDIISGKEGILLNSSELTRMQKCVDYWEKIIPSTKKENVWAVYYNLAVAYSWMINDAKAQENFAKVLELNKDTFAKIENKSGSFGGKDLKKLRAYNFASPFVTYYAKGMKNHPNVPKAMSFDAHGYAYSLAINNYISDYVQMPVPLPVFPSKSKIGMKKCTGQVKIKDLPVLSFDYEIKKGKLEGIKLQSTKSSPFKGLKASFDVENESNKIKLFAENTFRGQYSVDKDLVLNLYNMRIKNSYIYKPFRLFDDVINQEQEVQAAYSNLLAEFTSADFLSRHDMEGAHLRVEFNTTDLVEDTKTVLGVGNDDNYKKVKALDVNRAGIPRAYQINYSMSNNTISLLTLVKYRFGEETSAESARQARANRVTRPVLEKKLHEHFKQIGAEFKEMKSSKYDFSYSETIDLKVTNDDKGNWTEIKFGDYTLTRLIKY